LRAGASAETNQALELGRRGFELFNARRLNEFWALQHPEIVMSTAEMWPGGGTYHGVDGFKRFLDQFFDAFSQVRFEEVREPALIGDVAVLRGRWVGAGATTGIETESIDFSVVFATRDGLLAQVRFFVSDTEAHRFAAELQAAA
jgi:ketosteroid isomerase-like protein